MTRTHAPAPKTGVETQQTAAQTPAHGPSRRRSSAGDEAVQLRPWTSNLLSEISILPSLSGAQKHRVAADGVRGGGAPFPHFDRIQRAFGPHDLSGVQAHLGSGASASARALGAEAYAIGEHAAFRRPPSLFTAAHEAAHIVQQRSPLPISGGFGEVGDRFEQQADAVAHAVTAGRSAADLLGQPTSAAAAPAPAVQLLIISEDEMPLIDMSLSGHQLELVMKWYEAHKNGFDTAALLQTEKEQLKTLISKGLFRLTDQQKQQDLVSALDGNDQQEPHQPANSAQTVEDEIVNSQQQVAPLQINSPRPNNGADASQSLLLLPPPKKKTWEHDENETRLPLFSQGHMNKAVKTPYMNMRDMLQTEVAELKAGTALTLLGMESWEYFVSFTNPQNNQTSYGCLSPRDIKKDLNDDTKGTLKADCTVSLRDSNRALLTLEDTIAKDEHVSILDEQNGKYLVQWGRYYGLNPDNVYEVSYVGGKAWVDKNTVEHIQEQTPIDELKADEDHPKRGKILPTEADDPPISVADVTQRGICDCYLQAALVALVSTNPSKITALFDLSNEEYVLVKVPGKYSEFQTVKVNRSLFMNKDANSKPTGLVYAGEIDGYLWPAFYQKALAVANGGYEKITWGSSYETFQTIMGSAGNLSLENSAGLPVQELDEKALKLYELLKTGIRNKQPMTMLTGSFSKKNSLARRMAFQGPTRVPERNRQVGPLHTYAVLGLNPSNLETSIKRPDAPLWGDGARAFARYPKDLASYKAQVFSVKQATVRLANPINPRERVFTRTIGRILESGKFLDLTYGAAEKEEDDKPQDKPQDSTALIQSTL